jgi:hypothetical protein
MKDSIEWFSQAATKLQIPALFPGHMYEAPMKLPIAALAALATLLPTAARDNGQWADSPATVRQWFQSLMQPDKPYLWCCGEADAFEVDH